MAIAVELKVYGKLGGGAEVLNAIAQELGGGDEFNGVAVVFGFEIHWCKLRGKAERFGKVGKLFWNYKITGDWFFLPQITLISTDFIRRN